MSNIPAVILAGGKGTRFRPLTRYIQKTMIPLGSAQKPILEYAITLLKYHKITDITIVVRYLAEQVKNYFGKGKRFDININYLGDDEEFLSTGNAVYGVLPKIKDDNFVLYYGDIVSTINLTGMIDFHKKNNAVLTMALASSFPVRVGVATVDMINEEGGYVTEFYEKPNLGHPTNMAIYVVNKRIKDIFDGLDMKKSVGFNDVVVPRLLENDHRVFGYICDCFWYDVGSLARYEKLDDEEIDEAFDEML